MKNKKYLITGGNGFIGSAIIKALAIRGDTVRSLDNNWRGSKSNLEEIADKVEFITGDIRDYQIVRLAVKGVDRVCHLAAINGTENFYTKPELVLEVAVKGILNILDACREHNIRELLVMSSSEVYQCADTIPTPESVPLIIPDPLNPRYSYSAGKIISEMLALHAEKNAFDRVQIVRPHNIYGPKMGWEHVIPQLILRILAQAKEQNSRPIKLPIQGSGMETRAFCYIDDMVQGVLKILDYGGSPEIYNVGTEDEITIKDLAQKIGFCLGYGIEIIPGQLQKGSTLRRCPDISKLKNLGYCPQVSLNEGLMKTVEWYSDPKNQKLDITNK